MSLENGYPPSRNQNEQQVSLNEITPMPPAAGVLNNAYTPPPKSHGRKKFLIILAILAVIATAVAVYFFVVKDSSKTTNNTASTNQQTTVPEKKPYLVFLDYNKRVITLTDKDGKNVYETSFTGPQYPYQVTASPAGEVLAILAEAIPPYKRNALLIDSTGKLKLLPEAVINTLVASNGDSAMPSIVLKSSSEALLTTCTSKPGDPSDAHCKLTTLNIDDGSQKTLTEADAPTMVTGETQFSIKGLSSDNATAYLSVMGPSTLDASGDVLVAVNLSSGEAKKIKSLPTNYGVSISPDAKTLVYATKESNEAPLVMHVVDMANPSTDTPVTWINSDTGGLSAAWAWSPDGTKMVFRGSELLPNTPGSTIGDETLAYLDVSKSTITTLQTIKDAKRMTSFAAWIDNQTVTYQTLTSSKDHDFTVSTPETFTQLAGDKDSVKFNGPAMNLQQLIRY